MMRTVKWLSFTLAVAAWLGCGDSDPKPDNTATNNAAQDEPEYKHPAADAAKVVTRFLTAIKKGDEESARQLLTVLAQKKTAEIGMEIAPAWSEGANFTVGEVEIQENGVAHVGCVLKDAEESMNIVWALRGEKEGWRVAGLATRTNPDEDPLILDYEQPEEIVRQFSEMEDEGDEASDDAAPADTAASDDATEDEPRTARANDKDGDDESSPPPRQARRAPAARPAVEVDVSESEVPDAANQREPTEPRRLATPPKGPATNKRPAPSKGPAAAKPTADADESESDAPREDAADSRPARPSSTRRK